MEGVIDETKMTAEEKDILHLLALSWNQFLRLPVQHPNDIEEFMHAIHEAQRIIAIRGVRK